MTLSPSERERLEEIVEKFKGLYGGLLKPGHPDFLFSEYHRMASRLLAQDTRIAELEAENEALAQNAKDWHEAWIKLLQENEALKQRPLAEHPLIKPQLEQSDVLVLTFLRADGEETWQANTDKILTKCFSTPDEALKKLLQEGK